MIKNELEKNETTRTFTYTVKIETKKTVDIELPVYSKHDMDDVIIYHKLFSRNKSGYTIQSISVDDSGETSFKENTFIYSDLGENTDYYLGIGEYACKPEEYARALDATKRTLSFWEE